MNHSTNLVIISGPSGAGEDSVIQGLIERGIAIERVITTVTRDMRKGESKGKPYYFISPEEFDEMIKKDEIAEWALVYGNKYGVTKQELERVKSHKDKIGIWKIEWHGVKAAKKLFPDILTILITVPSINELIERSTKRRQQSEQEIKQRVNFTKEWLEHKKLYDYEVLNEQGKLDETIDQVVEILRKEECIK
jgi:guanylate kinase